MPTRRDTNFPRLKSDDEFEDLILELCKLEWEDPSTQRRGRSGQRQDGVDIYGNPHGDPARFGAQCKLRTTDRQPTEIEIEAEVAKAMGFVHHLELLILVTDAPRDIHTQNIIDAISVREQATGGFRVVIWFWDEICHRVSAYNTLQVRFFGEMFANLSTLPVLQRLIERPLYVLALQVEADANAVAREEALVLRGIRLIGPESLGMSPLDGELLDGVLLQTASVHSLALRRMAVQARSFVGLGHPILVILPGSGVAHFLEAYKDLDVSLSNLCLIEAEKPLHAVASEIFKKVFAYGYGRRVGTTTLEIGARSSPNRFTGTLLDADWSSRLAPDALPTPLEWETVLAPALADIRSIVLGTAGDSTRIQLRAVLPMPAAFAWGFAFNLRVARLGTWARQSGVSDFKQRLWMSDGRASAIDLPLVWVRQPIAQAQNLIVELTTGIDIHLDVAAFASAAGLSPDGWLKVGTGLKDLSLRDIDEGTGVAFANRVGQIFRSEVPRGITDTHLFLRLPAALAVLVGQRLISCGRIHLYWYTNPGYQFAFTVS